MKTRDAITSFVVSGLLAGFFLISMSCHAGPAAQDARPALEPVGAASEIEIRSRSLRYEQGSEAIASLQVVVSLGDRDQALEFHRGSVDLGSRLLFALLDIEPFLKTREHRATIVSTADLLIGEIALVRAGGQDVAVSDKLKKSVEKTVSVARTLLKSRSADTSVVAQRLMTLGDELKARVVSRKVDGDADAGAAGGSSRPSAEPSPESSGEIAIKDPIRFLKDGQDLFDLVASHLTYEQQAATIGPISRDLNEALTIVRAHRSQSEISAAFKHLAKVISAREGKLIDIVSTPAFSTTGPQLRNWIHSLGEAVGDKSRFELKPLKSSTVLPSIPPSAATSEAPSRISRSEAVVPSVSMPKNEKLPTRMTNGPIVWREVPAALQNYLDFIRANREESSSEGANQDLKIAQEVCDKLKSQLAGFRGDVVTPAVQVNLVEAVKALRPFTKELDRLKMTARTQMTAMQYGIWVNRFEGAVNGAEGTLRD